MKTCLRIAAFLFIIDLLFSQTPRPTPLDPKIVKEHLDGLLNKSIPLPIGSDCKAVLETVKHEGGNLVLQWGLFPSNITKKELIQNLLVKIAPMTISGKFIVGSQAKQTFQESSADPQIFIMSYSIPIPEDARSIDVAIQIYDKEIFRGAIGTK